MEIDLKKANELKEQNKLVGIFEMSNDDYHKAPGISKSVLDKIQKTPMHFKYAMDNPSGSTPAKTLGSAIHTLVLEPHLFGEQFAVNPNPANYPDLLRTIPQLKDECSRRSLKVSGTKPELTKRLLEADLPPERIWDNFVEGIVKDRTILNNSQYASLMGMKRNIDESEIAQILLQGHKEKAFFAVDGETGVILKCKPDITRLKSKLLADLKKTRDASPGGFMKSVYEYNYHVQAAFYIDVVGMAIKQGGKGDLQFETPDMFSFIAVEEAAPHPVAFYDLEPEFIEEGRMVYKNLLNRYIESLNSNKWNGYDEKIIRLKSKSWMYQGR